MELREVILKRRSIRKFTEEIIPEELVQELLTAAMAAPSACNKQPWEFYVIRDEKTRKKLRGVSLFTRMNATLMIVVAGNRKRAVSKKENDFWIQDCAAATENILLTATDLGLGACWCGLYPMEGPVEKTRSILSLPEEIIPMALIQLGYPDQAPAARTQYDEKKVHII